MASALFAVAPVATPSNLVLSAADKLPAAAVVAAVMLIAGVAPPEDTIGAVPETLVTPPPPPPPLPSTAPSLFSTRKPASCTYSSLLFTGKTIRPSSRTAAPSKTCTVKVTDAVSALNTLKYFNCRRDPVAGAATTSTAVTPLVAIVSEPGVSVEASLARSAQLAIIGG